MTRAFFTSILPTFLTGWTLPQTFPSLEELILRAVPKKKTSHSRKSMRSANKGLKDKRRTCFRFVLLPQYHAHLLFRSRALPCLRFAQTCPSPVCQLLFEFKPVVEGQI